MTNANVQQIEAHNIRTDMGTQTRETIDDDVVQEYAAAMEAGAEFPPIVVFFVEDKCEYVLADGYHRLLAHRRLWPDQLIDAVIREGTIQDAQWFSYSANKAHGLRRKPGDKARATRAALLHPHGAKLSNRQIAEHVGVSEITVRRQRENLESTATLSQSESRTGRDGRTINTSNIGNNPPADNEEQYEPQRVCNECDYYDDMATYCSVKKQLQRPWAKVCDKYKPKRSHVVKPKHRPVIPNRRMKGTIEVFLPPDNPQLAAVELRESFPLDYLRSVFHALEEIEGSDCAA